MIFVGVTGGVGAGKSSILTYLQNNYKCKILMTDNIAQDIKRTDEDCIRQMQEIFKDDDIYNQDGSLSNNKLAKVIFANKTKRDKLNAVVHPAVRKYVMNTYEEEKEKNELDFLVVESALLLESKFNELCDEVWYIYASEKERRKRLKLNRGYDNDKIDNIFKSQLKEEDFRRYSNFVIDNNGSTLKAYTQLDVMLKEHGIEKDYEKIKRKNDDIFDGVMDLVARDDVNEQR